MFMIKGIGIDIIELARIKQSMNKQQRFVKRILTEKELEHYDTLPNEKRQIEYVAGRFAAKEAVAKATGRGIGELSFQHIEILVQESGAPYMAVQGYETDKIHVSISHSEHYAVAQVIIETL